MNHANSLLIGLLIGLFAAIFAIRPCPLKAAENPNIVFVLFDDNDHTVCLNDLLATADEIVAAKIPDNAGEDSVSLVPELRGTAASGTREATVHQSAAGDLAIRQGPWKMIFFKSGKRELYNLQTDLSETKDVLASNGEVATKLTALMQSYIDNGRSTVGEPQKNDFDLSITGGESKGKRKKNKQKSEAAVQSPAEQPASCASLAVAAVGGTGDNLPSVTPAR